MVTSPNVLCEPPEFVGGPLTHGGDLGGHTCDDKVLPNPETAKGWILLAAMWLWVATKCVVLFRKPPRPDFWKLSRATPVISGGDDHRYGQIRGGPMIFGGSKNDDDSGCSLGLSPIFAVRVRMVGGKLTKVGWTLRRPEEYRGSVPKALPVGFPSERDTPSPL